MAQVVAHDGTRLLVFTRSAEPQPGRPLIHYGRILDLPTLRLYPERYLDSLAAHGQWEPLDDPVPVDRLLAMASPNGVAVSCSDAPNSPAAIAPSDGMWDDAAHPDCAPRDA